ncbi:MAG: ATP-binding cassette domain-containing protein, partial [Phycisphaerales bacterium]
NTESNALHRERVAVRDFNLEIEDGEFVVLVGPSGCGKSTTLRMIAGLESIHSGTISIGGRVVNKVRPKDRDIAMVFQSYALYPHLSVGDNMGFSLRMDKTPQSDRLARVREAAEMLGLESVLDKKPGQLSGGQRQRVALGRAIVRKPAVFLFDEPLSNLDPDRRAATRAEIRRIQRELGTTTVYVTHDHEEAMALGDRIVIMKDGELEQVGSPSHIYENPKSLFVGMFLGAPKMNAIACIVRGEGAGAQAELLSETETWGVPLAGVPGSEDLNDEDHLTVGIRPQHIELDADPEDGALMPLGTGTIIDIERLGFACDLAVRVAGLRLVVRSSDMTRWSIGQKVSLSTRAADLRVFKV